MAQIPFKDLLTAWKKDSSKALKIKGESQVLGVDENGNEVPLKVDNEGRVITHTTLTGSNLEDGLLVKSVEYSAQDPFSGTSDVVHTFSSEMTTFTISNDGDDSLFFTIHGYTFEVKSGEVFSETFAPFKKVSIKTTVPFRAYGKGSGKNEFLYSEGTEVVAWSNSYTNPSDGSLTALSKESDHIYLMAENSSGAAEIALATDMAVDLTNFNSLYIDWENIGANLNLNRSYFIVASGRSGGYGTAVVDSVILSNSFERQRSVINVSHLTGEHYIRIHARDGSGTAARSELKIYNIWGV